MKYVWAFCIVILVVGAVAVGACGLDMALSHGSSLGWVLFGLTLCPLGIATFIMIVVCVADLLDGGKK